MISWQAQSVFHKETPTHNWNTYLFSASSIHKLLQFTQFLKQQLLLHSCLSGCRIFAQVGASLARTKHRVCPELATRNGFWWEKWHKYSFQGSYNYRDFDKYNYTVVKGILVYFISSTCKSWIRDRELSKGVHSFVSLSEIRAPGHSCILTL